MIAIAQAAGYERLVVESSGCRQSTRIPWELIKRPPETPLADLAQRLVCKRCGKNGPLPRIAGVSRPVGCARSQVVTPCRSLDAGCPLTPQALASLSVQERVLLFCLASGTDWERAGVTHATAQQVLVRGLIDRASTCARFKLTPLGRDVLAALLKPPIHEQDG